MKHNPKPLDVEDLSFDRLTIVLDDCSPVNPEATLVAVKAASAPMQAETIAERVAAILRSKSA